jgi:hypothetical protein
VGIARETNNLLLTLPSGVAVCALFLSRVSNTKID